MDSFRIDTLLHSVKELQNEKNCLEYKLNEQRNKRRQLEKRVETANAKLIQVNDVYNKMSETQKVAEMKVCKTQSQAVSLEEMNQMRRQKILDMNNKINTEKDLQQKNIDEFEENLVELAMELKQSRKFYRDDNIEKEIISSENKIINTEGKVCDDRQLMDQLNKELLKMEKKAVDVDDAASVDDAGIPDEMRRALWLELKEENQSLHRFLDQLQEELNNIHNTLQESMK